MGMAPKTVDCGSAMWSSADTMQATSTSPARRATLAIDARLAEQRSGEERELDRGAPGDQTQEADRAVSKRRADRAHPVPPLDVGSQWIGAEARERQPGVRPRPQKG